MSTILRNYCYNAQIEQANLYTGNYNPENVDFSCICDIIIVKEREKF